MDLIDQHPLSFRHSSIHKGLQTLRKHYQVFNISKYKFAISLKILSVFT